MDREKFMQNARNTARQILEGKENGIMNLVQHAWDEGKRNAEVETLKEAVVAAFDNRTADTEIGEGYGVLRCHGEIIRCYIGNIERQEFAYNTEKPKRKFTVIEL